MNNKCETCKNSEICKFKEEYQKKFTKVENLDSDKMFPLYLDCIYYPKQEPTTIPHWEAIPIPTTAANPCERCFFYETYIKKGQTYVGDAPCNWCEHRQPTVTWNIDQTEEIK